MDNEPLVIKPTQLLVIGDSHGSRGDNKDGWTMLLREAMQGRLLIHNLGISGLTSQSLLHFLKTDIIQDIYPKYCNYIILSIGTNDASYQVDIPYKCQWVELSVFEKNLREIFEIFRKIFPEAQIIYFTPPNVGTTPRRKQEVTEKYQEVAIKVSEELKIIHFTPDVKENDGLMDDGIHLDKIGNERVFDKVREIIKDPPFWRAHWSKW